MAIEGETALIGTANELAVALDALNGRQDRTVLEQLRPHLAEIIGGPPNLANVMRTLRSEDQLFLLDAIGANLVNALHEARHLRDLLAMLSIPQVKQRLIETLGGEGLRAIILTARELANVLEWVYGDAGRRVLDLLGEDHLRRIIRHGEDLGLVLNGLDESAQTALIEKIGWTRVIELVTNGRDLALLLRALPAAISASLLDHYSRKKLIALIGNELDWEYLFDRIEPSETDRLLEKLGVNERAP